MSGLTRPTHHTVKHEIAHLTAEHLVQGPTIRVTLNCRVELRQNELSSVFDQPRKGMIDFTGSIHENGHPLRRIHEKSVENWNRRRIESAVFRLGRNRWEQTELNAFENHQLRTETTTSSYVRPGSLAYSVKHKSDGLRRTVEYVFPLPSGAATVGNHIRQ